MRLTTKGRYGLRLMLDLAMNFGKQPVLLKDIAKRQDISEKYLWQLVSILKSAKLINSVRGAHGGYKLIKNPREITLKEIISTLEGSMCLVDCVENSAACKRSAACSARDIWVLLSGKIIDTLKSFTLEELVNNQKKKNKFITYTI